MKDKPVLDGRTREEILERQKRIAPHYVDDWNPETEDSGTAMLEIFSDMAEGVIERLDRLPEKHQTAFFDTLDFSVYPPQPAELPVTFSIDEGAPSNVRIPPGTRVKAPESDDRPRQTFETPTDEPFEATPATLTDVFTADPGADRLVSHTDSLEADEPIHLFLGDNIQKHALYLGHDDLLMLDAGSTIELQVQTNASLRALREYLEWEYYGTNDDGEEGWHPLEVRGATESPIAPLSEYQQARSFVDQLEGYLEDNGYELIDDDERIERFVRSFVDDIKKGRFASSDGNDDDRYQLPANLFDTRQIDADVESTLQRYCDSLRQQLQSSKERHEFGDTIDQRELLLDVPGEITEYELEETTSRWIRCRIPETELSEILFGMLVDNIQISVGAETETLEPDTAVTDDIEVDLASDTALFPLGKGQPVPGSFFAISCEEALTKPGATITLEFDGDDDDAETSSDADTDPELIWEYWNGVGWQRLPVEDQTSQLRSSGTVVFDVPPDIATRSLLGQKRRWVRVRLVNGHYGEPRMEETSENSWERVTDHIAPPEFDDVRVRYERNDAPFEHVWTHNNGTFRDVKEQTQAYRPFESVPGDKQTLYLGFDQPLCGGPLQLYLPIAETKYPYWFDPWLDMEYCSEPQRDKWDRVEFKDETENLSRRGVISFSPPEQTTAFELFGRERHWLRIRVTKDEFSRGSGGLFVPSVDPKKTSSRAELHSVSLASRERSHRTRSPPTVEGLFMNTQWVRNIRTIDSTSLGSSDGRANQELSFEEGPVLNADLWVDEARMLSEHKREALRNADPDRIQEERDADGTVTHFWVRWTEVSDFLNSDSSERHYVLDEVDGTVRFGDGKYGRIPPAGENNIKASYETGGGADGNVETGDISGLKDDISFVDDVYNPVPGNTGDNRETTPELVDRAPRQLRDRDRSVTRDGFERIASSAAREIGRVRCKAGKSETGKPGHVTLLVVPELTERKPVPSEELLEQVTEEMKQKAPVAVTGDESNLTVRGPHYVEVSIQATVTVEATQNITDIQERARDDLTAYLHPLTGGTDGTGWEIGYCPPPSAFVARLEQITGIQQVSRLTVTFDDGEQELTLSGAEPAPTVAPDTLIYSGAHTITVGVGRDF